MPATTEWFKRCPNRMSGESEIEIHQVFEAEDFGEAFTPELKQQAESLGTCEGRGEGNYQERAAANPKGIVSSSSRLRGTSYLG